MVNDTSLQESSGSTAQRSRTGYDRRTFLKTATVGAGLVSVTGEQNVNFVFELATRGYAIDTGSIVFEGGIEEMRERDDLLEKYLAVSREEVA